MKPTEITGDRSVSDFCKWIRNFGHNGSGHFDDFESCDYVSKEVEAKIKKMGGCVDETNDAAFLNWIEEVLGANFVSADACRDFIRQVAGYLSVDEFIGVKP